MRKTITLEIEELYCDSCGIDLETKNGFPHVSEDDKDYCLTCAYKKGIITKKEWAEAHGLYLSDRKLKWLEVI